MIVSSSATVLIDVPSSAELRLVRNSLRDEDSLRVEIAVGDEMTLSLDPSVVLTRDYMRRPLP
jgi:hypothetical protein